MTIIDYSNLKDISDSTVRRYIRSNKIIWKKDDGRYLIELSDAELALDAPAGGQLAVNLLREENIALKRDLKRSLEDNNELKMLVQLYEAGNKSDQNRQVPFM